MKPAHEAGLLPPGRVPSSHTLSPAWAPWWVSARWLPLPSPLPSTPARDGFALLCGWCSPSAYEATTHSQAGIPCQSQASQWHPDHCLARPIPQGTGPGSMPPATGAKRLRSTATPQGPCCPVSIRHKIEPPFLRSDPQLPGPPTPLGTGCTALLSTAAAPL